MHLIILLKKTKLGTIGTATTFVLFLHLIVMPTCKGLSLIQCKNQADCPTLEYCEQRYANTCQCNSGYVRVNGGTCIPERSKGDHCVDDKQCSHLGLACYRSRCSCPNGLKRSDGSCFTSPVKPDLSSAPTPPIHMQSVLETSTYAKKGSNKSPPEGTGGYAGPIAICALIFVSFSVLIITTSYNFKIRSRRLEEVRAILDAHAAGTASVPNARRASIGSIRDAPPSYNTLSPPSYEQAIGQSSTSLSRVATPLRRPSYSHSMETAPVSISDLSSGAGSVRCAITPTAPSTSQEALPFQQGNGEGSQHSKDRY